MIYLSLGLLFLGIALLVIEAFIPGFGVLGVSGIAAIIISSVIVVFTVPFGPFIVIGEIIVLAFAIYMLFKFLKKNQLYNKLILNETLNSEKKDIGNLEYYIGKEGVTKTSLRPFGTVDFDGVTVEVCSDSGYVEAQKSVVVTEISGQKIMVKLLNKN